MTYTWHVSNWTLLLNQCHFISANKLELIWTQTFRQRYANIVISNFWYKEFWDIIANKMCCVWHPFSSLYLRALNSNLETSTPLDTAYLKANPILPSIQFYIISKEIHFIHEKNFSRTFLYAASGYRLNQLIKMLDNINCSFHSSNALINWPLSNAVKGWK